MPVNLCPSFTDLELLLDGQLQEVDALALEEHLSSCSSCQERASQVGTVVDFGSDTLIDGIVPDAEELQNIKTRLKALINQDFSQASEPAASVVAKAASNSNSLPYEVLTLLTPAGPNEDILGRLCRYEILQLLGKGGMGFVLLARDAQLHRQVAIKIMSPALASQDDQKERFLREARSMAAIRNDHVVEIYQVDEDRSVPFLVMPVLYGETLEARRRRVKCLPLPDVLKIGREVALGLAAAHSSAKKLIHRDVKPANIWLEAETDRVKLLDFGLALEASNELKLTNPGTVMGSAPYMSPEQAAPGRMATDERTDLFSLGCVLYEISTGVSPFVRGNLYETLQAVVQEDPLPADKLNPELPERFVRLLASLLTKVPAQRPKSARAVVDELEAIERDTRSQLVVENLDSSEPHFPSSPSDSASEVPTTSLAQSATMLLHRYSSRRVLLTAGTIACLLLLAVVILQTDKQGKLVVEYDDPTVRVTILENNKVLLEDTGGTWSINVTPGLHEFEVILATAEGKEISRFRTDKYSLARGGNPILNISQEAKRKVVHQETENGGPDRQAAEWLVSQPGVFLQGHLDGKLLQLSSGQVVPREGEFFLISISFPASLTASKQLSLLDGLQYCEHFSVIGDLDDAGFKLLCEHLSPNLLVLNLMRTGISNEGLRHLSRFSGLQGLVLYETPVGDAGMEYVAGLKHLKSLDLLATNVSDTGLSSLSDLSNLETLRLRSTRITDDGLPHLERLKKLRDLNIGYTLVTDAGIARLIGMLPHLETLELDQSQTTDTAIPSLLTLTKLQTLAIRETYISRKGYESLKSAFPEASIAWSEPNDSLTKMVLKAGGVVSVHSLGADEEIIIREAAQIPSVPFQVTGIQISSREPETAVIRTSFEAIAGILTGVVPTMGNHFPKLTSLEFSGPWLTDDSLKTLNPTIGPETEKIWAMVPNAPRPLSGVQDLSLTSSQITDNGLAELAQFRGLRKLVLNSNPIRGNGLKHLQAFPQLTELHLDCPKLTDVFLASLVDLPKLEILSLASTGISNAAIDTLTKLKSLKQLDLTATKLSPEAADRLKSSLPECEIRAP